MRSFGCVPWMMLWAGALALALGLSSAQAQVLGKPQLREALDDLELRGRWYYEDLEAARAEAQRTGKPLFVLLRCPP